MQKKRKENIEKRELVVLNKGFTRDVAVIDDKIIESKHDLSLVELKSLIQCITLIDNSEKESELKRYKIGVKDFCEKVGLNTTNRFFIYSKLRELLKRVIEIQNDKGDYIGYTLFSMFSYLHKEQMIYFAFNSMIEPYILNLRRFVKIKASITNKFNSMYGIRFYLWLKNYRKMAHRDFDITALTEKLELPKSYTTSYTRLYNKVISPAIQEINAKSDLNVSEPEIIAKSGKKILKFRLYFEYKSQKIANEVIGELVKKFKEQKSFNVFRNCFFAINENVIFKIDKISTQRNTYFEALTLENGDFRCIFGTPNKDDFLRELCNGIFNALCYAYEKEKQEQLPTMQWQDQQDRQKRLKEILRAWQEPKQA